MKDMKGFAVYKPEDHEVHACEPHPKKVIRIVENERTAFDYRPIAFCGDWHVHVSEVCLFTGHRHNKPKLEVIHHSDLVTMWLRAKKTGMLFDA